MSSIPCKDVANAVSMYNINDSTSESRELASSVPMPACGSTAP